MGSDRKAPNRIGVWRCTFGAGRRQFHEVRGGNVFGRRGCYSVPFGIALAPHEFQAITLRGDQWTLRAQTRKRLPRGGFIHQTRGWRAVFSGAGSWALRLLNDSGGPTRAGLPAAFMTLVRSAIARPGSHESPLALCFGSLQTLGRVRHFFVRRRYGGPRGICKPFRPGAG